MLLQVKVIQVLFDDFFKRFKLDIFVECCSAICPFFAGAVQYLGMTNMMEIVRAVREDTKAGFLYLSPAVPKSSVNYHYYNLK